MLNLAYNCLVYEQALDLAPLTEAIIRGLHVDLMQHYPPAKRYAGQYKTSPSLAALVNHKFIQRYGIRPKI